ncbi:MULTISPECIES: hypothetical protein [unclassified Streptomyces]|uniref:hypothetical protein n=1 Tax=unclassified Streptomyces TaxID=2593676 RepID=UPI00364FE573
MTTTDEGPLWLSAIRDASSRRVVAWETFARVDADRVLLTRNTRSPAARLNPASSFTMPITAVSQLRFKGASQHRFTIWNQVTSVSTAA